MTRLPLDNTVLLMADEKFRETAGREELVRFLEAHGAASALAREIGVAPSLVSRWLSGARVPELKHALALRDALGIAPEQWTLPPPVVATPFEEEETQPAPTGTHGA